MHLILENTNNLAYLGNHTFYVKMTFVLNLQLHYASAVEHYHHWYGWLSGAGT